MRGIDISVHNGTIDFNRVKEAGIAAVIIKATEGMSYVDPRLEEHYNGVRGKGIKIGFYHFMSEKTDPEGQAVDFLNSIKNKNFDIYPVLDIESNNYGRSKSQITDRCVKFLNKFKAISGYDCIIYTGGYFGRDNLDSRVKGYKAWIAHYGVSQPMATGFANVVGHQYSESGSVSGVNGNCDLDNFTDGILINGAAAPVASQRSNYSQKVADVQRIAGCNVDGIYGPETDNAIRGLIAGIDYTTPALTRWIQGILGISVDGIFGPDTKAHVIAWQEAHRLVKDGIAGYNTIKSMALS